MKKRHSLKVTATILICVLLAAVGIVCGINFYVKNKSAAYLVTTDEAASLSDVDCILVLGCKVKEDGTPSDMLRDRITRAIELYEVGSAPKLLMSGDHGRKEYDELVIMKQYAIDAGVLSSDIFMDHAGFSTYESMYRAKEIFKASKIIIVTQEYHLYRALYLAREFGMEAFGVPSDYQRYWGQSIRDFREALARCKDFATAIFRPKPTYLGEAIPVSGNGDSTND